MSQTVIVGASTHANKGVYHTDICGRVRDLKNKGYTTQEQAEQRGMQECTFCAGEFEGSGAGNDLHNRLQEASASEVLGE